MNIKFRRRHLAVLLAAAVIVTQFAVSEQPDATADVFEASSPTSYAEIWVPHTTTAGFTGGCTPTSNSWYIEPEPGCDKTLTVNLPPDTNGATSAELYFDIWAGRNAHRVRYSLNGGPNVTVNAGYDNSRTPVVLTIDPDDLQTGSNTIRFSSINNKYHIHDVAVRLYGVAGTYAEAGGLTAVGGVMANVGGVLDVTDTESVTITAEIPDADRVEFIAYYDGFDEDNDGETVDWHAFTRSNYQPGGVGTGKDPLGNNYIAPADGAGGTIGHIGTVENNGVDDTYTIDWDTSLVASQTGVKIKARAGVVGASGRLDVADVVGGEWSNFEIFRSTYLVEYFRDTDFADSLIHVLGAPDSINRFIALPADIADWQSATHQGLYWQNPFVEWNGGTNQTAFIDNEDVWDVSHISIPIPDLLAGTNTISYSYNSNTTTGNNRTGTLYGQHVEEPGAMLVVKRTGTVKIYADPQSRNAVTGQQVTLNSTASGLGPLTYQWTCDGVVIPGATDVSYSFEVPDPMCPDSENYRLVATNAGGSVSSQPATVTVLPEAFTTDDFSDPAASSVLWDQVDSFGGGNFSYTGAQAILSVPEDTASHQPWTLGNRAPTLRQYMSDTDFDLMVAFESAPADRYQIQGLIFAGPGEFLRFDVNHDGTTPYAFAARMTGNSPTIYVNSVAIPSDHASFLRVLRDGDDFTMFTSNDGASWVNRGSFTHAMSVDEFGLFGGNAIGSGGTAPEFHAVVDYVDDLTMPPIVESDDDSLAPAISNVDVIEGPTSIVVNWTTDEPTTGSVDYMLNGLPESRDGGPLGYEHQALIVGLAPETVYALTINAHDYNGNMSSSATSGTTTETGIGDSVFDIWYGDVQDFGQPGSSQRWVNVLGRVSDPQGIDTLEYRLNGGTWIDMGLGDDGRRLHGDGDFNVDLLTSDLTVGGNTVELRATDILAAHTLHTVTVNWDDGHDYPLPYAIDWSSVGDVTDVVLPIDGYWTVSPDGLTINNVDDGYDRLAAIGEQSWSEYEVTVPITVSAYSPNANASPSNGPGIGMMMRWNGHNDSLSPGSQPQVGFTPDAGTPTPLGAIVWFRDHATGADGLQILDENATVVEEDPGFTFDIGTTYMFKARVEGSTPATYSLKVWDSADIEPPTWSLQWTAPGNGDEPTSGSILLVAHEVDALFGEVIVVPAGEVAAEAPTISPVETLTLPDLTTIDVIDEGGEITISSVDAGAVIYYTTDGSTPDATSALYTSPFTVVGDADIRAISYVPGMDPSTVAFQDYTFNAAPVAVAGSGLTLDVGVAGALAGSFTDVSHPDIGPATTSWSLVSGPGNATFGDASSLTSTVSFDQAGSYVVRLTVSDSRLSHTDDVSVVVNGESQTGYWMVENDGTLYPFGDAAVHSPIPLGGADALSIVTTNGSGVWVLDSTGMVYVRGASGHFGDLVTNPVVLDLGENVASLSVKPDGTGYWIFTSKGRAIPFGSASFFGDMTAFVLDGDVIASVSTTTGLGYYMVGSDGGIFTFGDAVFYGSVPQVVPLDQLAQPLVGIAPDPDGAGYWLVAGDGGIFSFAAPFVGSVPGVLPPGVQLAQPVVGAIAYADGYLAVAADGGIFNFSSIAFLGSLGLNPPDTPVKGVAAYVT